MPTLLDKWKVLGAVMADRSLQGAAQSVAFFLLNHLNSKTGRCDPSVDTLCQQSGLSRRGVQKALQQLVDRGHFTVSVGGGRKRCSSYQPARKTANDNTPTEGENSEPEFAFTDEKGEPQYQKGRTVVPERANCGSPESGKETGKETGKSANALVHREITQSMVDIWNQVVWLPGAGKKPCRLSDKRHKALSRRLKDTFNNDIEEWRAFCGQVHSSPFLAGRKTRWRASLDWCLKPENLTKILEGNYHDDEQTDRAGRKAAGAGRGQSKGTARTAAFLGFPDEF